MNDPQSPISPVTLTLIKSSLSISRTKYPQNTRLLAALMSEIAELTEALQKHGDLLKLNNEDNRSTGRHFKSEAADAIAVLIRIIEEGDASFLPTGDPT